MLVKNNLDATNTAYLKQTQTANEKKNISSGQQLQKEQTAAELKLSSKLKQKIGEDEKIRAVAEENILSAESDAWDVAKADEMIRQANKNILAHADDAIKVQSYGQTAEVAIELLK